MTVIANQLQAVRDRIAAACVAAGRSPDTVRLLAVSKSQPASALRDALAYGQEDFGESYLQEAFEKIQQLTDSPLTWHFIGPIQSNKTAEIARYFHWVHSVDRLKIAQRLNEQRPTHLPALQICIQVNISGESSKSGIEPQHTLELARSIQQLPRLQLRGLMTIPKAQEDINQQRQPFKQLRELQQQLIGNGIALDTLSMGMSDDLEAAIYEGATIVRIGTAIFGKRNPKT